MRKFTLTFLLIQNNALLRLWVTSGYPSILDWLDPFSGGPDSSPIGWRCSRSLALSDSLASSMHLRAGSAARLAKVSGRDFSLSASAMDRLIGSPAVTAALSISSSGGFSSSCGDFSEGVPAVGDSSGLLVALTLLKRMKKN